jgi:hypothetical protein
VRENPPIQHASASPLRGFIETPNADKNFTILALKQPSTLFSLPSVESPLEQLFEVLQDASANINSQSESVQSSSGSSSDSKTRLNSEVELKTTIEPPEERTFNCFPKLAPGLRIRIWKEACNVTRNLDLWIRHGGEIHGIFPYFHPYCFPPPASAHHHHYWVLEECPALKH